MIREALQDGYERGASALRWSTGQILSPFKGKSSTIQLLYTVALVALMAGFTSAVDFPVANQGIIIFPSSGAETVPEAIIDATVIALGAAGIYLTIASGRQTAKSRTVNLYLLAALLLIVFSLIVGMGLRNLKG